VTTEDPSELAYRTLIEAHLAVAEGRYELGLEKAQDALAAAWDGSIQLDEMEWTWPLAVRAAFEVADDAAIDGLIGRLDTRNDAQLLRLLRAERALARARRAARHGDPSADELFEAAIAGERNLATPYHLAHALLDHAEHLAGTGRGDRAVSLVEEASDVANRLGAAPLVNRVAAIRADNQVRASL
jgi:Xaa-Pro aminopeptidase